MPPTQHPLPLRALLLLPPAPSPPTYAALKAAYSAPLLTVLQQLARSPERAHERAILEIALPSPHLYGQLDAPRGRFYAATESLVAGLYKLVCILAAQNAIDTEDAEGVDARIILVAYPRNGKLDEPAPESTPEHETQGPAVDLYTLARSPRSWEHIFSVQCEEGEGLLKNFLALSGVQRPVQRVRGGIVTVESAAPSESQVSPVNHRSVAVGGTFDHMHIGHKLLLTMFAFVLGRRHSHDGQAPSVLTVGITGDELLKNKKYAEYLESWHDRQQGVHDFLTSVIYFGQPDDRRIGIEELNEPGPNGHAVHVTYPFGLLIKYVEIWDPFGPTITDDAITALVLSLETRSGGKAVNSKRAENGWGELEVFEVSVLDASEEECVDETFQSKLSSTEIRRMRSERSQSQK
ncbi:pantetheine-phosphate adenylyltransferase family protein-like protein [Karstenula rhodostoma CBS 690.94]|uniref:Pantetheine-phosphate adenylyltransferase family protein-like protein n=1 Tax=Karstenula rhodostoma CBS 690.94 TaxID=1392251 RepID=A0A9P4U6N1_9PLEO|nr:pantetheine-phosphate adenylyltransferase family protein-like protein [Karstenula rhodostoma CBS 690.94]